VPETWTEAAVSAACLDADTIALGAFFSTPLVEEPPPQAARPAPVLRRPARPAARRRRRGTARY
jgi:hypothetical protein